MGTERDALAAQMFPEAWAAVATLPGASKKRQQIRKRAEERQAMTALQATGARCGNCEHYEEIPTPGNKGRMHCSMQSDFDGWALTFETSLCLDWSKKS